MKKSIITLFILALFASCGTRGDNNAQQPICPTTHDYGVLINGIRWATRNVDMPGTFAETPESFGMLFQWNRKKAWNAIDELVEDWAFSFSTGTKWYAENDPCPKGWRVPTENELRSLQEAGSEWTSQNGVYGHLFGTAPYQLFLPAAGWRGLRNGTLLNVGTWGNYWGARGYTAYAWNLWIDINGSFLDAYSLRSLGFSIRCVTIN